MPHFESSPIGRRQFLSRFAAGSGLAWLAQPSDSARADAGCPPANACCPCPPGAEHWLISTLCAPVCGNIEAGFEQLKFWRSTGGSGWQAVTRDEFVAANDPAWPTTFYLHGYDGSMRTSLEESRRLAATTGGCGPFRMVTWLWPARHELFAHPLPNLLQKKWAATVQGYYLARLLLNLNPQVAITLVAHSLGSRAVASALHGLATRVAAGQPLPDEPDNPQSMQVALIAPALLSHALVPGGEFGHATSLVDRLFVTMNPNDLTLKFMGLVQSDGNILGLTGLSSAVTLRPNANGETSAIARVNTEPWVKHRHMIKFYTKWPAIAAWLRTYMVNTAVPQLPGDHAPLRIHAEPTSLPADLEG